MNCSFRDSRMKFAMRTFLGALALVLIFTGFAWAQTETGQIGGTVKDSSGAVVPDAKVTVMNLGTTGARTTTTSNLGTYIVPGLTPGNYEVTVSKTGFATYKSKAEVTVGGYLTIDVQLVIGQGSTVVEVVAGGATQVNTETQELSQLVNPQQMMQLPSLTRNPYDFVALSGNVSGGDSTTPNTSGSQNISGRGVGFSLNGQRESGTEILLDGLENVDLFGADIGMQVPVDSVQEYRVITNNFNPEYGRASGGVVNVTTKTGSNTYHGSAWEFNRLSKYTANTFANDAAGIPKGTYTRNMFGFEVGGPLIKDKLFVYEGTEWLRVRSAALETEEVLDPTFISTLPTNIKNYFNAYGSGVAAATSTVTAGQLKNTCLFGSSSSTSCVPLPFPSINGVTAVPDATNVLDVINFHVPYDAGGDVPQNTYRLSGRLDFNMTSTTQMFFRFSRENETQFLGSASYTAYPQYDVGYSAWNDSGVYSLSHSFSPAVFSNTKIGFSRLNNTNSYNTSLTSVPNLMLAGYATDPVTGYAIQLPGLENTAPGLGGLPYGGPQNTTQVEEDLSWTKGKHSMKFGGQFTYIQLNKAYGAYAQAVEQLGSGVAQGLEGLVNSYGNPNGSPLIAFASRVNPNGVLPCNATPVFWATNDPADLVQTASCAVTPPLSTASYARSYRYKDWAMYAQDSFKVTSRLVINYGLRYEHYGVQHNDNSQLDSNFYFGPGAGLYQQVRNGQVDVADTKQGIQFWRPRWGTASPRVGFAYDVFGDGKTSVRGGGGISYERNFGNVTFNASFNPPASAVINAVCSPTALATCSVLVTNNGLGPLGVAGPPSYLPPAELRMPAPNINVAQTQFWSLAVQRELAPNTLIEVGYSGAHGVHLYDVENINLWGAGNVYLGDNTENANCNGPTDPNTDTPICLTRPNSQYSNINMRGSLGVSSYNAMNVKFQTQNLHKTGLTLVANYTWSHSLDDLSSTFSDNLQGGSGAIGDLGYTNVLDPKLDWGNSDFDIRQRIVVSPIWETPWFKGGKGFTGKALGGWTLSDVFTARTGVPFSVFDYSYDLNYYTVPRLTPATPITKYSTGSGQQVAANENLFNLLSVPVPAVTGPLNPTLGISDFGPYPSNMTGRNTFRGPGAWNTDFAVDKSFKVTERLGFEFRAELFNLFNHHNMYVNTANLDYGFSTVLQGPGATMGTGSTYVTGLKGGLGSSALYGNHDERRFGQFSLRLNF